MKGDKADGRTSVTGPRREKKRQIDSRTEEIEYMPEEKMIKADGRQVGGGAAVGENERGRSLAEEGKEKREISRDRHTESRRLAVEPL